MKPIMFNKEGKLEKLNIVPISYLFKLDLPIFPKCKQSIRIRVKKWHRTGEVKVHLETYFVKTYGFEIKL